MRFVRRKRQRRYRNGEDIWFIFAREVSESSSCTRRKVGAVLVNPMGGLISFGWNLEANGRMCEEDCPRGQLTTEELPGASPFRGRGRCIATHAEMMAIDRSATLRPDQMNECHIYITCDPCTGCREVLDQLGIHVHSEEAYE